MQLFQRDSDILGTQAIVVTGLEVEIDTVLNLYVHRDHFCIAFFCDFLCISIKTFIHCLEDYLSLPPSF